MRTANLRKVQQETKKIAYIYNQAWAKNWGFVPWTDNEMKFMGKSLKAFADPDLVILPCTMVRKSALPSVCQITMRSPKALMAGYFLLGFLNLC